MTTGVPRRRRAEFARPVSDLWRGRGVALGALAGALVLVVVLALRDGTSALLSPGPLAQPHAAASCTSCHTPRSAVPRCDGCHVEHASRRAPHAALVAQGALACEQCHRMHGRDAALVFEPNGAVTLVAGGSERELARGAVSVVARETFVPLVAAATCARCHALSKYAAASHHHHKEQSPESRCAACHMPVRTYMVVDQRHDHSFRIPRPDESVKYGTLRFRWNSRRMT